MLLAYVSDVHFGVEHDEVAYKFAVETLAHVSPNQVFLGGDIFDHAAVSTYAKSLAIEGSLQRELDYGFEQLTYLIDSLDGFTTFEFLPGNHESRIMRYLQSRAKPLIELQALDYKNLYRLDALGIEFHPEGKPVKKGHLWLAHGHEFPTGGVSPSRKALDSLGVNVLFGHVHKFTSAYKRNLDGKTMAAWSNGCLADLNPGYVLAPDWVQGYTLVDFTEAGNFAVTPVAFWRTKTHIETVIAGQEYRMALPRKKKA